jgi:hypothetical protein
MIEGNSKTKSERPEFGKRVNLTANDVASPPTQEKGKTKLRTSLSRECPRDKLEAVEKWLRATLAKGPVL